MPAPVDLTRFDFYALRFMQSESVRQMSAEEVGQYILLMCQAWLGGKNASLPDNPELLASYARCSEVSERVLACWSPGEDGRLYNERLSQEWEDALTRSTRFVEDGRKGGQSRSEAKVAAVRENGKLGGRPAKPKPEPNQTKDGFGGNLSPINANAMQTNASQCNHANGEPPAEQDTGISSDPHFVFSSNGNKQSHSTPGPDDLDMDWGQSPAESLACLLYDVLPPERQGEAPRGWEQLWATDIAKLLETETEKNVRIVIEAIPHMKWAQFIYRGENLLKNFPKMKADYNKIKRAHEKAKGNS